ncbi:hypothetical protein MMC25_005459 [Agyrium rufum]|nr:hypothetical protein [Agyrium rufum]
MAASIADQITQLEAARQIVLADHTHYAMIVPGILGVVTANSILEIKRWGADFLAEAFASPMLPEDTKEKLGIGSLERFNELLESTAEDEWVVKSVIQAVASIYPLVFRYIIHNPTDATTWERMAAIKSKILKRWDAAVTGVRLCCIKFVEEVIRVQTPGMITNPEQPKKNEISLALVPPNHPLIALQNLEAEASGLLDRLLDVFHADTCDPLYITATLNCLAVLVRDRPVIALKIVNVVLYFNPFKNVQQPITSKARVQLRSMERTVRAFLLNIYRRNETSPFAPRIKQHIDRLAQYRIELLEGGSKKRGAPTDQFDGTDNAKRQRTEQPFRNLPEVPPLPSGPISIAQLYTLTEEQGLASFDVTHLPIELVLRITVPILQKIHMETLQWSVGAIRSRFVGTVARTQAAEPLPTVPPLEDDEEEYEPNFEPAEDEEQIINKLDIMPVEDVQEVEDLAIGPFRLPQPPLLQPEEAEQLGQGTIMRVFGMMEILEEPPISTAHKPGLHRLAGSNYDRDAWMTIIQRLATRAPSGLEAPDEVPVTDDEDDEKVDAAVIRRAGMHTLSNTIREYLCCWVIESFRARMGVAISWLNEEWYNDRMQAQHIVPATADVEMNGDGNEANADNAVLTFQKRHQQLQIQPNYEKWVLRVLDGIIPYLDAKDKILIRFLSEIPVVSADVFERVKNLARDPERVTLAVNSIYYLILFKPPVRDMAVDALEDLYRNYDGTQAATRKFLTKYRPSVLENVASEQAANKQLTQQEVAAPLSKISPVPLPTSPSPQPPSSHPLQIPASPQRDTQVQMTDTNGNVTEAGTDNPLSGGGVAAAVAAPS